MTYTPYVPEVDDRYVITRSIDLPAPVERVWRAVSDADEIAHWFPNQSATLDLQPGGTGLFTWEGHGPFPIVVEALDEPHYLAWSWGHESDAVGNHACRVAARGDGERHPPDRHGVGIRTPTALRGELRGLGRGARAAGRLSQRVPRQLTRRPRVASQGKPPIPRRICLGTEHLPAVTEANTSGGQGREADRAGARSPRGRTSMADRPSQLGHRTELLGELVRRLFRSAGFGVRAEHPEHPVLAVGLEVDPADDPVAEQEREHVVAVHPLRLGHVDLDPVEEVEELLGALALPDDRVERAEQRPRRHLPRQLGVAVQVCRLVPAVDLHREQLPVLDQLVDRDLDRCQPADGSCRSR